MSVSHCSVDETTCHTSSQCGFFGADGCVCNDPPGCVFPYPPPCSPDFQCEQPLNCYENDGCGNRREDSSCCPVTTQKWKCSDPVTNTCVQAADGTYDTEALCKAASNCQNGSNGFDLSQYVVPAIIGLVLLGAVYYYFKRR